MYPLHADSVGGMGSPGECFQDFGGSPINTGSRCFFLWVSISGMAETNAWE